MKIGDEEMSYLIEIDDVLECIDDAQDGSKKTYDILADVFNRVLALPSAESEPMVIRCKEQLTEEDFRAIATRIREESQNVIVIPCETEVVSSAEVAQGWIPVSERLPKDDKIVLVTDDEGFVRMMSHEYIPDGGYWFTAEESIMVDESEIVAWMPLPDPYKGGDDE